MERRTAGWLVRVAASLGLVAGGCADRGAAPNHPVASARPVGDGAAATPVDAAKGTSTAKTPSTDDGSQTIVVMPTLRIGSASTPEDEPGARPTSVAPTTGDGAGLRAQAASGAGSPGSTSSGLAGIGGGTRSGAPATAADAADFQRQMDGVRAYQAELTRRLQMASQKRARPADPTAFGNPMRSNGETPTTEPPKPSAAIDLGAPTAEAASTLAKAELATGAGRRSEPTLLRAAGAAGNADYDVKTVYFGTNRVSIELDDLEPMGKAIRHLFAIGTPLLLACVFLIVIQSEWLAVRFIGSMLVAAALLVDGMALAAWYKSGSPVGFGNTTGSLTTGRVRVSIPHNHRPGRLESPNILKGELRADPAKHVAVLKIDALGRPSLLRSLDREMEDADPKKRRAFVFIHGFNVSFEDAARRTAQLAFDLDFKGAACFFSWPASGGAFLYKLDEENVATSGPSLREFLLLLAKETQAEEIHLIAHSMGNRALTAALAEVATLARDDKPAFSTVMFTAPDVGEKAFRDELYPLIRRTAKLMTLYASANDVALKLSKAIHDERRLGDATGGVFVFDKLDSVDVSSVDTSFVGHNYYGDNTSVITDIKAVLDATGERETWGWISSAMNASGLKYWVFKAGQAMAGAADHSTTR